MHQVGKLQILNPHLTCMLCKGYFIDATTIIECLHSFCKSCIVRYLETNKFCPVCEVQIHKTKPLLNVRPDQTLQDVVYKVVPGLFQNEMRLRKEFYSKHPDKLPSTPEERGEVTEQFIYSSDETICLSLEYADNEDANRRFLRCPAAVTVGLLKRLIRGKYGLDNDHALDILYDDAFLCDEYSLVDLAYIYNWRRKGPMRLKYRIYQRPQTPVVNGEVVEEVKQVEEAPSLPEVVEEAPVVIDKIVEITVEKTNDEPASNGLITEIPEEAKTIEPEKRKRPSEEEIDAPSPAKKAKSPKFFKARDNNKSIVSVTESPVQEVAVNLCKISPKKPAAELPPRIEATSSTSDGAIQHLRFPVWQPRGFRPPPLSQAFMASLMPSHLPYLYSQPDKKTSPRFSIPTFNLNSLQQYPAGLSHLFPALPRELGPLLFPSFSRPRSSGFHASLPPTAPLAVRKSSPRPLVPRRAVAPPPPLVPIAPRSPPTLLPIKDVASVVESSLPEEKVTDDT